MKTTPVSGVNPSISVSSWLRVCSRSSLALPSFGGGEGVEGVGVGAVAARVALFWEGFARRGVGYMRGGCRAP